MPGCPPDEAELACIRADLEEMVLDTPCTIKRPMHAEDAYGSQDQASLTTIATVNVNYQSISRSQSMAQLQPFMHLIGSHRAWLMNFPWGTNVQSGDYLDFGAHPTIGSDLLVVQAFLPDSFDMFVVALVVSVK